ncbi:MAG: hypothetical protein D4S01_09975, partial [Dehalococcoidia bacterium]
PQVCEDSDRGTPFVLEHQDLKSTKAFMEIVEKIEGFLKNETRNKIDDSSNNDRSLHTTEEEK